MESLINEQLPDFCVFSKIMRSKSVVLFKKFWFYCKVTNSTPKNNLNSLTGHIHINILQTKFFISYQFFISGKFCLQNYNTVSFHNLRIHKKLLWTSNSRVHNLKNRPNFNKINIKPKFLRNVNLYKIYRWSLF